MDGNAAVGTAILVIAVIAVIAAVVLLVTGVGIGALIVALLG